MMSETKKAFLRRLGRVLFWRLPSGEARAIVEDYSGFFDDRMAEGKRKPRSAGSSVRPQRWRGRFCVSPGGGRSRWAC